MVLRIEVEHRWLAPSGDLDTVLFFEPVCGRFIGKIRDRDPLLHESSVKVVGLGNLGLVSLREFARLGNRRRLLVTAETGDRLPDVSLLGTHLLGIGACSSPICVDPGEGRYIDVNTTAAQRGGKVLRAFAKDSDVDHDGMLPAHRSAYRAALFWRERLAPYPGSNLLREEQGLFARDQDREHNTITSFAQQGDRAGELSRDISERIVRDDCGSRNRIRQLRLHILKALIHHGEAGFDSTEAARG